MDANKKTVWEHITELKNLALKLFGVWIVATGICAFYSEKLIDIFTSPLNGTGLNLNFMSPTDSLFFVIKIVSIAGLLISSPLLFLLLWQYLAKALDRREKKFLFTYLGGALVLTILATIYSYIYLIPTSLKFLTDFTPKNTKIILSANEYSSFLLSMLVVIIVVFQTPIMVLSLVKTGLVKVKTFRSKRKEIYFTILVLTAAFGSPDVFTWLISSIPVLVLFEGSLLIGSRIEKQKLSNA